MATKKLVLNKETLRMLDGEKASVVGGMKEIYDRTMDPAVCNTDTQVSGRYCTQWLCI